MRRAGRWITLVALLVSGCASAEPILAERHFSSEQASAQELDAAVAAAITSLGYVPIRHVSAPGYQGRAAAAGDERHTEAEPRSRARVVWTHVTPGEGAHEGRVHLIVEALAENDIPEVTRLADEVADAVRVQVPDLSTGAGSTTGLGYDPAGEWARLEVGSD